jgi:hypothetical protein
LTCALYASARGQASHPSSGACGLSSGQMSLSTTIFESSRCRLNIEATRVAKYLSIWSWRPFLFFPFPSWFSHLPLRNLKALQFLSLFSWLLFVLFVIIYKIEIVFQFHPVHFFLSFKFGPHSFDCCLFCLRSF